MTDQRGEIARAYLQYGRGPLRMSVYLRGTKPRQMIGPALWLAGSAIGFIGGVPWLGWLALGMFTGWLAISFGSSRRVVRAWPAIASLLDWEEVERVAANQVGENIQ